MPTPPLGPTRPATSHSWTSPSSSLAAFTLDARTPQQQREFATREAERDAEVEGEVQRLLRETRLWRAANSAQWVAWGIVQARVEGFEEGGEGKDGEEGGNGGDNNGDVDVGSSSKGGGEEAGAEAEAETADEFDYLAYARDRALFFWGDMLRLGLVGQEELPQEVLKQVKMVEH